MKARVSQERRYFRFSDMEKAEKAMRVTWNILRNELNKGTFSYNDITKAKECTFLSVFDSLFIDNNGFKFFETSLFKVFKEYHMVRGAIINEGESSPNYERFLPKSVYITDDNRFSPKGVEWLYLALGFPRTENGLINAKKCS